MTLSRHFHLLTRFFPFIFISFILSPPNFIFIIILPRVFSPHTHRHFLSSLIANLGDLCERVVYSKGKHFFFIHSLGSHVCVSVYCVTGEDDGKMCERAMLMLWQWSAKMFFFTVRWFFFICRKKRKEKVKQ